MTEENVRNIRKELETRKQKGGRKDNRKQSMGGERNKNEDKERRGTEEAYKRREIR